MKDTILNMLENEPLVKKAFLLLLEETPEDKQDELLKAINASFEKEEPYQALEARIDKMLADEYTEELTKGTKEAVYWLMEHFPLNELGSDIGNIRRLDYRALFLYQYDRNGHYFTDVNNGTKKWEGIKEEYKAFEKKIFARVELKKELQKLEEKMKKRAENLKEVLIYRKYDNITSIIRELEHKVPKRMVNEILKYAYKLGYKKPEHFEEWEDVGMLCDYYRTHVLKAPNYGNTILEVNMQNVLRKYYSNDNIIIDHEAQAPKLSKQLKKAGVTATNEELITFNEFKQWLGCVADVSRPNEVILLDMGDFTIPNNVDNWAFQDSCNTSGSCAGNGTALVLKAMGYKYLKLYRYDLGTEEANPLARAYFKTKYSELAHAGMYSEGRNHTNRIGYTAYDFTSLLLATVFKRKLKHFKKILGQTIESGSEFKDAYNEDINYWSNMSGANDYKTLGTASILEEDSYSKWADEIHDLDMSIITNYDDTADKFEARIKELKEKLND